MTQAPALFPLLPSGLFGPLASPNREHYWLLLCRLFDEFFGPDAPVPPSMGFQRREITAALQRFGIEAGTKVLLVLDGASDAVKLSVRNLEKVKLIAADQLNVFDLLNAGKLVVSEEALAKIQEVYGDG